MFKKKHLPKKMTEDVAATDVWDGPQRERCWDLSKFFPLLWIFIGIQQHSLNKKAIA